MGKIKIAPNYSVVIEGKKYNQGEIVEVTDTSKYIGKKYAIIIEKSLEKKISEEKEIPREKSKSKGKK